MVARKACMAGVFLLVNGMDKWGPVIREAGIKGSD